MIEGEALNFKITYPPDLERFRMVLETKDNDVRQS
jgi:2-C-methyl-D-erythritol 4-phosphate cytidylyltransferase